MGAGAGKKYKEATPDDIKEAVAELDEESKAEMLATLKAPAGEKVA